MPGAAYSLTQVISPVRYSTITQKYIFEEGFENLFRGSDEYSAVLFKNKKPWKRTDVNSRAIFVEPFWF